MRIREFIAAVLAIAVILPSIVSAQAVRNAKEAVVNNKQIKDGKSIIKRDTGEIQELEKLLTQWDQARIDGAMDNFKLLNTKIREAMTREDGQAAAKLVQAKAELGQSRRELRGERREVWATDGSRHRAQLRDDRRDRRDDRRDLKKVTNRAHHLTMIRSDTRDLLWRMIEDNDGKAFKKTRELYANFVKVMKQDLAAQVIELGEDRGERREDRRERRTDRSEGP